MYENYLDSIRMLSLTGTDNLLPSLVKLIEYRNDVVKFNPLTERNKLHQFDLICYINHQIANLLQLPNVRTMNEAREQLFKVELHNIELELSVIRSMSEQLLKTNATNG